MKNLNLQSKIMKIMKIMKSGRPDVASLAVTWKKWLSKLDNLFVALGIDDTKRQKALLLYYGGDRLSEIYGTLADTGDTYDSAKAVLNTYFEPKKNLTYEVYNFRKLEQHENEPINLFLYRLREAASRCEFTDANREIKKSEYVRRKALVENLNLDRLLEIA